MDNGFVSVVGVHQVHNGPVLAGYIKQVLNGLRVGQVVVALHIKNQKVGFGNIGYGAAGTN